MAVVLLATCCCIGATHPSLLWRDDYFDTPYDVITNGNTAYVAAGYSGVLVVDVTNPASPTLLGICNTRGEAKELRISGQYIYAADGSRGLAICDVSDPTTPIVVGAWGCLNNPCNCTDIDVTNTTVYLADTTNNTIYVLNTTDLTTITVTGTYSSSSGVVRDIQTSPPSHFLYVAVGDGGLQIVDVMSNPTTPTLSATYGGGSDVAEVTSSVIVSHNVAYVCVGGSLHIVNVEDPMLPTLMGSVEVLDGNDTFNLALRGDVLYAVSEDATEVINVAATPPVVVETCSDLGGVALSYGTSLLFIVGGGDNSTLRIYNATESSMLMSNFGNRGDVRDVYVSGTTAVANDIFSATLRVYDVTSPSSPTQFSTYFCGAQRVYDISIVGSYIYAATTTGLIILNITNPSSPQKIGSIITTPSPAYNTVSVAGHYAYVTSTTTLLHIIDVSNPNSPFEIGSYIGTVGMKTHDVVVAQGVAYLAAGFDGLLIIDVLSAPAAPILLGVYDTPGEAYSVDVSGGIVYIADGNSGLLVVDVSELTSPALIGSTSTDSGAARGVTVVGGTAYVTVTSIGLLIYDVSDPATPILLDTFDTDSTPHDVHAGGPTVYVADGGLWIISGVSPPPTPLPTSNDTEECTVSPNPCGDDAQECLGDGAGGWVCLCVATQETRVGGAVEQCPVVSGGSNDATPVWVWVLVGLVCGGVVGGVYYVVLRKKNEATTFQDLRGENILDEEEPEHGLVQISEEMVCKDFRL